MSGSRGGRRGWRKDKAAPSRPAPPSIIHSFRLASGKHLHLQLRYDTNQWHLLDPELLTSLEDLCLVFTRLGELVKEDYFHEHWILFEVEIDKELHKIQYDDCPNGVRFRVGPLLSEMLQEREVSAQSKSAVPREVKSPDVLVAISMHFFTRDFYDRGQARATPRTELSTRSIGLEGGARFAVLPELLALHSPFFCTLFFGSFAESGEEGAVVLREVGRRAMRGLVRHLAFFNRPEGDAGDWELLSEQVALRDRFLIPISASTERAMRRDLTTFLFVDEMHYAFEVGLVLQRANHPLDVLGMLLEKFVSVGCLTALLEKHFHLLSPVAPRVLSRLSHLSSMQPQRPKLHLRFDTGAVCVEFPTDHLPGLDAVVGRLHSLPLAPAPFSNSIPLDLGLYYDRAAPFIFSTPVLVWSRDTKALTFLPKQEILKPVIGLVVQGFECIATAERIIETRFVLPPF